MRGRSTNQDLASSPSLYKGVVMNYGVPYQGSKSAIAERILKYLPEADTLYDVFAGGCAISHCAMLSGKFKKIVMNDINPLGIKLFFSAVYGELPPIEHWISREMFFKYRDTDPYISLVWSFGNNKRDYMYGKEIEKEQYDLHEDYFSLKSKISRKEFMQRHRLRHVERYRRLVLLRSLIMNRCIKNAEVHESDYRELEFNDNGIIYCDIPYENTNNSYRLSEKFCYSDFYEWAKKQTLPVYVSSYNLPDDLFLEVISMNTTSKMNADRCFSVKEKLYLLKK